MECFRHWGCRARTLQGRKLLANTIMLSLLWHVTAILPIPEPTVQGWQSMLNKFILGRKSDPRAKYSPLLHRTWQFDRVLGLGLPHVSSKIRAQPLQRLQHLMEGPSTTSPPWQPLVQRQFSRTLGKLYRDTHPFDFLLYYPNTSSKWLCLWELHPLWCDIWAQWAAIPMEKRMPIVPNLSTVMTMPVWLTQYDAMRNHNKHCAANLAKMPPIRRWRHFVNINRSWPRHSEFISAMFNGNPFARVKLSATDTIRPAEIPCTSSVYLHLTRTYNAVRQSHHNNANADILPHPFIAMVKDNVQPFQRWPRRLIIDLAYHAPSLKVQHPMASTQRSTDADLKRYVRLVRRTCRQSPSLQADVWLRLLYNMLPVNSRFYYLQVSQPTAVCCAYGCGAVETQLHVFHQCCHVHHVWQFHACAWQYYGVSFDWSTISDLDNFGVNHRGVELKSAIFLV
ncbi:hypothetical protein THRCLA_11774 [Thraustotheca clavata]|uniref:Secreted protein n=1 Tax=Thraustotheca clavata TaxID=74557 RepID=A0A1V9Y6P7_9STRA|nr:hypothetical protein THRCLA_11774 [Thraustotheca clavata]